MNIIDSILLSLLIAVLLDYVFFYVLLREKVEDAEKTIESKAKENLYE